MSRLSLLNFARRQKEPLTKEQEQFLEKFQIFLNDDNKRVFILKGFAGTGKTHLIKILNDYFRKMGKKYHIAAPTGRAAKIINDKIGQNVATTIHSLLYSLDNSFDYENLNDLNNIDTFQLKFALKSNEDYEYEKVLYIFDEASMISNQTSKEDSFLFFGSGNLLADIFDYTKDIKNSKLLFVGDAAQLPPTDNSKKTPALESADLNSLAQRYFDKNSESIEECRLKNIMRQKSKNSNILKASVKLRKFIEKGNSEDFNINSFVKEFANEKDFQAITLDCLTRNFKDLFNNDENETRYITHTNLDATKFNCDFRYNGRNFFHSLQKGDILLVFRNLIIDDEVFYNGDFVKVLELLGDEEERSVNIKGQSPKKLTFVKAKIQTEQGREKELILLKDYFIYASNPTDNVNDDPLYQKEMKRTEQALLIDFKSRFDKKVEQIVKEESQGQDLSQDELNERKKIKRGFLFEYEKKQDKYLNALRVKFAYAVTCHKAQGGEWENVFVNSHTKHKKQDDDYLKWLYTAITRAKKNYI